MGTMTNEVLKKGERASLISLLTSLFLIIIKAGIGLITGSLVLISDAFNSGADTLTMIMSWFGFKISQRKPDRTFHYGYYKAESLAAFFISVSIVYAAIVLLNMGWGRLFISGEINMPAMALAAALVSALISFFLSRYLYRVGKNIGSHLLVITSKDRLLDVFSSLTVFIAVLFHHISYVEGSVTILISLLILRTGLTASKDSIVVLMDVNPSNEDEEKIRRIIKKVKGVDSLKSLKLRKAGPFMLGEAAIRVKKHINVGRAHEIADEIEEKIKKQYPEMESFTVHIEPHKGFKAKIVIPVKKPQGLDSHVADNFGKSEYFMAVLIKNKKIYGSYSMKNPFRKKAVKAGLSAAHPLEKDGVDVVIAKEIGEISFHTLRDHFIEVYKSSGNTARNVADNFINKKLRRFQEPSRKNY